MKRKGWVVVPHAKIPRHIFKNQATGKTFSRHTMGEDNFGARDAHEFVAYLNSRPLIPLYQIGGIAHGKLRR